MVVLPLLLVFGGLSTTVFGVDCPIVDSTNRLDSTVLVRWPLPPSIFVDDDQLSHMPASTEFNWRHVGGIDVEAPFDGHNDSSLLLLRADDKMINSFVFDRQFTLPLHVRYHPPNVAGVTRRSLGPSPSVFVRCRRDEMPDRQTCAKVYVEAPCNLQDMDKLCKYLQMPLEEESALPRLRIVVATWGHSGWVVGGTIQLTLLLLYGLTHFVRGASRPTGAH